MQALYPRQTNATPTRADTLALFCVASCYLIALAGLWLRRDGTLGAADVSDARVLFVFGWSLLPALALVLTAAVVRWLSLEGVRLAVGVGATLAVWMINLLALFPAAAPFNHFYGWALIPAAAAWLAFVGTAAAYPTRTAILRVVALVAVGGAVGAGIWGVYRAPFTITDRYAGALVGVASPRATLPSGGVRVTWTATGIAAIYANGLPSVGVGEAPLTPAGPNLALAVVFTDGTERTYTVMLQPIPRGLVVLAALVMLCGAAVVGLGRRAALLYPALALAAFWPFYRLGEFVPYPALAVAGVALAAGWALRRLWRAPPYPLIHAAAVGVVVLCGFNLAFPTERYHQNFYLAPVNDVLNGRTVFVDTNAQYGMAISYVLAAVFRHTPLPLTHTAMTFISALLVAGTFLVLYAIMCLTFRGRALPVAATLVMCLVYVYRGEVTAYTHMGLGPLRYGTLYVLVLLIALRGGATSARAVRRYRAGEYGVIALACVWSLEAAAGAVAVYGAVLALEATDAARSVSESVGYVVARFGGVLAVGGVALAGFWAFTWVRAATPPDPMMYLNHYLVFTDVPRFFDVWSPWVLVPVGLYGTLAGILVYRLATREREALARFAAPYALAWVGVVAFFYWVNLSLPTSVHAFTLPAIFGAFFWLDAAHHSTLPPGLRQTMTACGAFVAITVTVACVLLPPTQLPKRLPITELAAAVREGRAPDFNLWAVFEPGPPTHYTEWVLGRYPWSTEQDPALGDLLALIGRYAPGDAPLPLLLIPDTEVAAKLHTGRSNAFWFSHPEMDRADPRHILGNPPTLAPGDLIFTQTDDRELTAAQIALREELLAAFDFEWLVVAPSEVAVVRLVAKDTTP